MVISNNFYFFSSNLILLNLHHWHHKYRRVVFKKSYLVSLIPSTILVFREIILKIMFLGITGHVRIDDNGDRDADYSILDLDPITGRFEVVAHYYGLHK